MGGGPQGTEGRSKPFATCFVTNPSQAHYPMPSRGSSQIPPLVAEYFPKRGEAKAAAQAKRKFSDVECDSIDIDVDGMSDDALGRFWGEFCTTSILSSLLTSLLSTVAFVLLDIIRKSKFRILDESIGRLQTQRSQASGSRPPPTSAIESKFPRKGRTGWRPRVGSERLKDLTIGMMLQPRRWSL
jgi:hypothetical protein